MDPTPLEVPERRWGSLVRDFTVKLPKKKNEFDCITRYVDRLLRRVQFFPSMGSGTVIEVANSFFSNIFKHHGMTDSIFFDGDIKFTSSLWTCQIEMCAVK